MAVRLFIGNLPYGATEADLRAHFAAVAEPSHVVMPVDCETGRPRGFAFVEFAERAVAEEVIKQFDAQPFQGRTLAVSEARAREDRPPRPPGGRLRGPRPGGGGFGGPRPGGIRRAPARRRRLRSAARAPADRRGPGGRDRSANFGPRRRPGGCAARRARSRNTSRADRSRNARAAGFTRSTTSKTTTRRNSMTS